MFEKLITSLKQSLPGPLRKKLGVEDEEHSEEDSKEDFKESHDTSNEESENSVDDKKKKQVSMIIRVIVVIGLAYLAVDHFLLKENPQNEIANIPTRPRKRRVVKLPPKDNKASDSKPIEIKPVEKIADTAAETAQIKSEIKAETKPVEVVPPVENINIAEKKVEETAPPVPSEKAIDDTPIIKTPSVVAPKMGEVKSSEQVDKSLDSLIDSVDGKDKKIDESSTNKETKLEDKIVADDIYVDPPAYDKLGRGLVYNCKEKYWACIDKASYMNCNKNMKWNKLHGKSAECAVSNVYNSDDDCGVVQKYNVSVSKPTPFCQ